MTSHQQSLHTLPTAYPDLPLVLNGVNLDNPVIVGNALRPENGLSCWAAANELSRLCREEYDPRVNATVVDEAYSRALAVQEAHRESVFGPNPFITRVDAKLDNLTASVDGLSKEINNLSNIIAKLRETVTDLTESVISSEEAAKEATRGNALTHGSLEDLKGRLELFNHAINARFDTQDKRHAGIKVRLGRMDIAIEEVRKDCTSLEDNDTVHEGRLIDVGLRNFFAGSRQC